MVDTKNFNLLFTSAGRRVSLLKHFRNAMKRIDVSGVIISADMKRDAPAGFVADYREIVPGIHDSLYISRLKEICANHDVRLLIPLIDTELLLLAQHREEFEELGVTVLVSSEETIKTCIDKRKTYAFFLKYSIDTPKLFDIETALTSEEKLFPLLVKPAKGSSAIGVTKVCSKNELEFYTNTTADPVIQEFVTGQEYTIDVWADFNGELCCVVPRARLEVRAGEVSKGITVKDQELIKAASRVVSALPGPIGCITVQCFKQDTGQIKFIEINPRFGGGFPLAVHAGADFPRWIIESLIGHTPRISVDGWEDGVVMLRYDDAIFTTQPEIL